MAACILYDTGTLPFDGQEERVGVRVDEVKRLLMAQ